MLYSIKAEVILRPLLHLGLQSPEAPTLHAYRHVFRHGSVFRRIRKPGTWFQQRHVHLKLPSPLVHVLVEALSELIHVGIWLHRARMDLPGPP